MKKQLSITELDLLQAKLALRKIYLKAKFKNQGKL